jgi:hypothetical protein
MILAPRLCLGAHGLGGSAALYGCGVGEAEPRT